MVLDLDGCKPAGIWVEKMNVRNLYNQYLLRSWAFSVIQDSDALWSIRDGSFPKASTRRKILILNVMDVTQPVFKTKNEWDHRWKPLAIFADSGVGNFYALKHLGDS